MAKPPPRPAPELPAQSRAPITLADGPKLKSLHDAGTVLLDTITIRSPNSVDAELRAVLSEIGEAGDRTPQKPRSAPPRRARH